MRAEAPSASDGVRVRRGTVRRPLALSLIVLGVLVTLIGGTGIFAPFTDTANTGTNSLTSGTQPRAADIQIVWPAADTSACAVPANYVENSQTPGHSATDVQPGYNSFQNFCVKNVGTGTTGLNFRIIDRVETDNTCHGDEAASGDTTCGGGAAGELGSVLQVSVYRYNCTTGDATLILGIGALAGDNNVSHADWALDPGEIWCGASQIRYPTGQPVTDVLKAQTDTVTWAFQFIATVP